MPIWLRKFTYSTIAEFYKKEKEEFDKAAGKSKTVTETSKVYKPDIPITPTYVSKAPTKK